MANTRVRPKPRPQTTGRTRPHKDPPRPPSYQRWIGPVVAILVVAVVFLSVRSGQSETPAPGVTSDNPVVGADLHSLAVDPTDEDTLYIGSHQGVSVSTDGGESWRVIDSLTGADAMGWAFTDDAILVGGHPGINVSTDRGETFESRDEGLPTTDAHALGAGENVIYVGLAGIGTYASTDGGASWERRSEQFGGGFMGRIQVDPTDEDHILAPDLERGAVESTDGGRAWDVLGGVQGAMWVTWSAGDTDHMIVTGQGQAAESTDGGETWASLEVPSGASIVEFSPHTRDVLYAAVLKAPEAHMYISRDGGRRWDRL